ncbi:1,3-beta-glucanosyltransferase gel2 [Aspergillus sclerotialis]|uniref:1,3-beta-glucanosyltransferase n=1 Tax=Aspergillus sclerotialis TaxID=2070753 RepID=A0A3A2ZCQ3_9EURO|nr:1,3-beta-glucanosyltransferase gel2 [Aspergillus sclerotialis]
MLFSHLLSLGALATTTLAVPSLVVDGKDFVNPKTKDRFQIIGVDYQPGGSSGFSKDKDPLSDKEACLRDAAIMQNLGINTIRIYNLSPSLNHDECASIFNAAGIYMILDVNSPLTGGSLDRTAPWESYNPKYFEEQVFAAIEAFSGYPNTLGFFAGNEVINEDSVRQVPAYIRAVQRDMKDYIKKHVDRAIPVGYSAADVRSILDDTAHYMMCELKNSTSSRSDFFGLNSYSWCGDSSYKKAGYDVLTEKFSNASLPVFFSEYGCNEVTPRIFTEVQALYSQEMSQAFSGGLIYEYTQEDNNYGLVKVNSSDTVTLLIDYANLQKQYEKLDMNRIESSNVTQTSVKPVECSSDLIKDKDFLNTFDIPKRLDKIQKLIDNGIDKPNKGKLVDVSSTKIPTTVYDHNGKKVNGLKLNVVSNDQSNSPGSNKSGGSSSGSGDGDGDSDSDKDNAGVKTSGSVFLGFLSVVVAAFLL